MAKFVYGLSQIYWETDPATAEAMLLSRRAALGELHRLRDGQNTCDNGADTAHFPLPVATEPEERDRSAGVREYGFGSRESLYRDRKDRRASRQRGHRAGKK